MKLGALTAARMTGLPLVPVGVGVTSAWRVRSWDGFLVPKPFSTVRVAYGRPQFVARRANEAEIDEASGALQRELDASSSELQWIIDSYILVLAGMLLTMGSLADRFGRKRGMLIGMVILGLSSVLAAYSTNTGQLMCRRKACT